MENKLISVFFKNYYLLTIHSKVRIVFPFLIFQKIAWKNLEKNDWVPKAALEVIASQHLFFYKISPYIRECNTEFQNK